jgi:hypothetical protein
VDGDSVVFVCLQDLSREGIKVSDEDIRSDGVSFAVQGTTVRCQDDVLIFERSPFEIKRGEVAVGKNDGSQNKIPPLDPGKDWQMQLLCNPSAGITRSRFSGSRYSSSQP